MGQALDYKPVYDAIPDRGMNKTVKMACAVGMAIGLIAAAYGIFTEGQMVKGGDASSNTLRVQGAFLQNFMYFNGIAQGGFMMTVIGVVCYARWTRPFKRVAEGLAMFLPFSYALLLVFLFLGGVQVFPWHHQGAEGFHEVGHYHKEAYFDTTFFFLRQIIGLGLMTGLSWLFVRKGLRADLVVAKEDMKKLGLETPAHWDALTKNAASGKEEWEKSKKWMITWAPVLCIGYAYIYSMVAVDLSMSLAPYFFANMYPAWYFMSAIWSGLVWTAIFTITCSASMGITHLVKSNFYHDLGKLTFALCMFWGYTTFAQYLPIWYGNMTEEIGFILYRTHGEVFGGITQWTVLLCFAAPYVIFLSRGLKKQPKKYLYGAILMAIGIWMERYIVNVPSIHSYWMPETPLPFGFIEIGMGIGFLGLFVFVVTSYLSKYPGACVADEFMNPDPRDVHVHAHHD